MLRYIPNFERRIRYRSSPQGRRGDPVLAIPYPMKVYFQLKKMRAAVAFRDKRTPQGPV